ncbi:Uncharacterised protein [Bacillus subtilis]|nr:Uncharacterised protein [Bacillus subtilis]
MENIQQNQGLKQKDEQFVVACHEGSASSGQPDSPEGRRGLGNRHRRTPLFGCDVRFVVRQHWLRQKGACGGCL